MNKKSCAAFKAVNNNATENSHENKENVTTKNNNNSTKNSIKKSRKVSFRDYPPPAADDKIDTNDTKNSNIIVNKDSLDLRGSSVPEHPSCLSISEVSSAGEILFLLRMFLHHMVQEDYLVMNETI